ncbi:MAG TPA: CAP domain-containing protein [Candidatus Angelobacter sp.]
MRRLVHHFLAGMLLLALGTILFSQGRGNASAASSAGAPSGEKRVSRSVAEQELFDLINLEREKAGLDKLEWNQQLTQAAREHSRLLAANRTLSHQFDSEAALPVRLAAAGARFTASAENVATAVSAEEVHTALMHSPGHRANIMSPKYNAAGVGVVEARGYLFVTEDFAFATRAYTEAEFRDRFIASVNRARKLKGMGAMDAHADSSLRSAACSTNGNSQSAIAGINAPAQVVTFTLSDPERLPNSFMKYVEDMRWRRMGVGVCYRPDATYGYANFWVVAAFGN